MKLKIHISMLKDIVASLHEISREDSDALKKLVHEISREDSDAFKNWCMKFLGKILMHSKTGAWNF